jgi:hypothetical protein
MNLEELELAVLERLDDDFKSDLQIGTVEVIGENDDTIRAYMIWFTKGESRSLSSFSAFLPEDLSLGTVSESLVHGMHFAYKAYITRRDIV